MFQTLYQRYGSELAEKMGQGDLVFPWPATYMESLAPIDRNAHSLVLTGCIEAPEAEKPTEEADDNDGDEASLPPEPSNRLELSWNELLALPTVKQNRRIVSAQGWTYKNEWEGVLLKDVLAQVTLKPEATHIRQTNLSGETEYLPLSDCLKGDPLLCYQVGGQPLPALYGGPLWLMVFDRYTYKGLGQLTELALVETGKSKEKDPEVPQGFWQTRGYDADGHIQSGQYYAFDRSELCTIDGPGEVTSF